jgi:glutaredoxin-like protein
VDPSEVIMPLLSNQDRESLVKMFEGLEKPVKLLLAVTEDCPTCQDTRSILEEVGSLSEMIHLDVVDREGDDASANRLGLDRVPGIAVLGGDGEKDDSGIRYFGIPSGYEFSSLIQDIIMVGTGESGLSQATRDVLDELEEPVHIQVFVTPTCPYCPGAVHLAHQMAYHSALVTADMVEAIEFPDLAQKFGVMGVPRTVINDHVHVEGAVPEAALLPKILEGARLPV